MNDCSAFSNNAKVSIKIQKNEKLSNDQQQPNSDSTETPTNKNKTIDEKTNSEAYKRHCARWSVNSFFVDEILDTIQEIRIKLDYKNK